MPDPSLYATDFIRDSITWNTEPPKTVSFAVPGGYIAIHRDTGKVDIPPNLELDEAARQFWIAVEKILPRKPKP